jgi:major membrane immunogen (membrane-anchored lipoprotein)
MVVALVWAMVAALLLGACSVECKETVDCGNYQFCVNSKCEYVGGYSTGSDAGARDGGR